MEPQRCSLVVGGSLRTIHPLVACVALLCTGVGALVITAVLALAAVPVVVGLLVLAGWILALLLFGWALVEGLAALERWMARDSRFRR